MGAQELRGFASEQAPGWVWDPHLPLGSGAEAPTHMGRADVLSALPSSEGKHPLAFLKGGFSGKGLIRSGCVAVHARASEENKARGVRGRGGAGGNGPVHPGDPGAARGVAPAVRLELHRTGAAGPHGGHRGGIPPRPLTKPKEAPLRKVPETARAQCCPSFLQSWRGCPRGPGADVRPALPPTFRPSLPAMPLSPAAFASSQSGRGAVRSWGGHVCTRGRSTRNDRHRQRGSQGPSRGP